MKHEDIISMAREAGFEELFKDSHDWVCFTEEIERFFQAAFAAGAAAEREALEVVTKELLAVRDELAERGGRPKTNVFHQRLWDSAFKAYTDHALPAATAIDEALAEQPAQQQEPMVTKNKSGITLHVGWDHLPVGTKLYTSPPASKPLTDDEIWREYRFLWPFHPAEERKLASDILMFARAIEAAHGIKGDA